MNKTKLISICTALCLVSPLGGIITTAPTAAYAKNPDTAPATFADLAEQLLPTVVNISSTQKTNGVPPLGAFPEFPQGSPFEDFFEEFYQNRNNGTPSTPPASLGSGFIIDAKEGYIVTNNHVIQDSDKIHVTLQDDITLDAEVIGRDEKTDLAVLKVNPKEAKLTQSKFGNSDKLRVGDWVVAIGNPFGLGGTVTAGIISARQRNINSGPYDDFLQTDASINRGNSGGPMFNLQGEIIGINTAIYSPSGGSVGIGFAIPSDLAQPVIEQLIKYGRTKRGWLGVRIQTVTEEIAESLGLKGTNGALVASVSPNSPADIAQLQAGDIILEFNDEEISKMRTLPRIVAETEIGSTAKLSVWRNGKEISTKVKIGELEKAEETGMIDSTPYKPEQDKGINVPDVGFTLSNINEKSIETYGYEKGLEGVVITSIEEGSESQKKGLAEGDVIVEIYQQPADDASVVADIIAKAKQSDRNSVLLLVNHGGKGDVRFVVLRLQ